MNVWNQVKFSGFSREGISRKNYQLFLEAWRWIQGRTKVHLQLIVWKVIQQLINIYTRRNSVFHGLRTISVHFYHPVCCLHFELGIFKNTIFIEFPIKKGAKCSNITFSSVIVTSGTCQKKKKRERENRFSHFWKSCISVYISATAGDFTAYKRWWFLLYSFLVKLRSLSIAVEEEMPLAIFVCTYLSECSAITVCMYTWVF